MNSDTRKVTLDEDHWHIEDYEQRMTKKEWEKMLLNYEDKIITKGKVRQLVIRALSSNVVEVYKKPL